MYVLGITGAIAMGKSTVAEMFEQLGAERFDADAAVHQMSETSKRLRQTIARDFPKAVKNDRVDRVALSKDVFGNPAKLARLEHIIHPFVFRALRKFLKDQKRKKTALVVLDIPLLFETRAEDICDGVVVVTAPPEEQLARMKKRPNFSEEDFKGRLARQMSDEEKKARADFIIETGISKEETLEQVKKLMESLPL